jgi:hypothetical protein
MGTRFSDGISVQKVGQIVTNWRLPFRWNYRIHANSPFAANDLQIHVAGCRVLIRPKKMNGFANDGGKRPSAAPAQIQEAGFFCALVSFSGETTEKNDCFSISL